MVEDKLANEKTERGKENAKDRQLRQNSDSGNGKGASYIDAEMKKQADDVISEFRKKKSVRSLGTAILRVDRKVAEGQKLSAEENWLFAKANAQAKAGNRLYARKSKVYKAQHKKEWGAARQDQVHEAIEEGGGEDDEDEEDNDDEKEDGYDDIPIIQTISDKRRANKGAVKPSRFDYLSPTGHVNDADREMQG